MNPISTIAELDDELSRPTQAVLETLTSVPGDVIVLGASGKMGPTLARMIRRAFDAIGQPSRCVKAVARFSNANAAKKLRNHGVETIACDLLDRGAVCELPAADSVIFMAGQKFGTSDAPEQTWAINTLVPANIAERFSKSRIVAFSTGCVYPLAPVDGPGSLETDPLGPPGDYANSCVGRERIFTYFSKLNGTPTLLYRLSYAIDLRYGVLHDVATKVANGMPVDVTMGVANVIWQRDANARAIQSLMYTSSPPMALNVTGLERVSIRDLAVRFGKKFHRDPILQGEEGTKAWIWNAALSYELFGPPSVSLDEMIDATVHWIQLGGVTLGKPTHFEAIDGQF